MNGLNSTMFVKLIPVTVLDVCKKVELIVLLNVQFSRANVLFANDIEVSYNEKEDRINIVYDLINGTTYVLTESAVKKYEEVLK